jgi:peptidyl-prolyl cis-trans isomerase C
VAAETNANPEAAMTALFGDPAIVKGKGFQIKQSDLDQVVSGARANAAAANQQLPQDFEVSILNQLINIQVLLQTATPADQITGKAEADEQYTNLLKKFITPDAFQRQLKALGMTVDDLRAKATQEAVAKAALKRALNITVTEDEARDYYTQHPADFEQPELVHARHILLMTMDPVTRQPLPTNTVAAKRKQIDDLRKRILAGEDFATLAKEYSEDPGSKDNGGELPLFARGQMVPEFESAAFALDTNEVSEVVTTQFGYHLIKVLERTPAKKIDFATAETEIKDGLAQLKIRKLAPDYIKKLRADQQVEILDASLKAQDEQAQAAAAAAAAAGTTGTGTGN